MNPLPISRKRQTVATLAVLILMVVIVGSVTAANKKKSPSTTAAVSTPATTSSTSANQSGGSTSAPASGSTQASSGSTKDGNYTATGTYDSPGGTEQLTVSVTLKNGVITDTSAKSGATDPEAEEYENAFISAYKSEVVGKSIAGLSLDRVGGASLTTQGFNDAIKQIESQAQA